MSNGHWQLEGTAAELYERHLVPTITTKWAEDLLDRAQPRAGEAVLDIACGTGVVARLAAERMVQGQPMTVLLRDRAEAESQAIISSVASKTVGLSTPATLDGDRFTFTQEAYVAIAQKSG